MVPPLVKCQNNIFSTDDRLATKRRERITPVLASLHWLPVCLRIDFKIYWFTDYTFKAIAISIWYIWPFISLGSYVEILGQKPAIRPRDPDEY